MSQNESKAGSEFNSIAAHHLTLKLGDLELCSPPYPQSLEPALKLIPRSEWANYLNRTSKLATSVVELYGWYSEAGERWMNALLESIKTPAQAVAAFQKINVRVAFYKDMEEGASLVLKSYCQRLLDGGIVELLTAVPKLPKDIWSITTRFLLWSLPRSSPDRVQSIDKLLRKIMLIELLPNSILHRSVRGFSWEKANQRKRTKNMPAEANPIHSWVGQSYVKELTKVPIDGNGSQLTISQFVLPSAGDLESFAWEIASTKTGREGRIFEYGFSETLQQAAEDAYVAFHRTVTRVAFESASMYAQDREIVLFGNELTSAEFLAKAGKAKSYYFLVQLPLSDDRDQSLFCLNWLDIQKVKRTFKITKVDGKKLTIEGGTKLDIDTVHCYVKQPEQYVTTQVLCTKCNNLALPQYVNGRFIQGVGYQCGPCIDNSVELGELSDGQFDQSFK